MAQFKPLPIKHPGTPMPTSKVMSIILGMRHDRLQPTPVGGRITRLSWDCPRSAACAVMGAIAVEADIENEVLLRNDG
jgi:hypothetical protein